jgi:hypothetical protein
MELTSRPLSNEEWMQMVGVLVELISARTSEAIVMLGIGAETAAAEQWEERTTPVGEIVPLLQEWIRRGWVELGRSDVFISSAEVPFEIRACRSDDVHFKTDDESLFRGAEQAFATAGVWNVAAHGPAPNSALQPTPTRAT